MLFPKGYKELVECKHNIDDTNTHYKKINRIIKVEMVPPSIAI